MSSQIKVHVCINLTLLPVQTFPRVLLASADSCRDKEGVTNSGSVWMKVPESKTCSARVCVCVWGGGGVVKEVLKLVTMSCYC